MNPDQIRHLIDRSILEADTMAMEQAIMQLYHYQYKSNISYRSYVDHLSRPQPQTVSEIPYMPISAFKHHEVQCGEWQPEVIYTSSGTTSQNPSKHYVRSKSQYLDHAVRLFEQVYGSCEDYVFLALLPSYLERKGSSLIDMMQCFIGKSKDKESAFYLHDHKKLFHTLQECQQKAKPTILFGVSFALMDFFETYQLAFPELIVMETGGMKGRRTELPKAALHQKIIQASGVSSVHSEYGMTELMSQLYSEGHGAFDQHAYLQAHIRDISDPLSHLLSGRQGIVCLRDLANIDSCAFIMTEDTGYINADNQLVLTGRLDMAEARGCNLLLSEMGLSS